MTKFWHDNAKCESIYTPFTVIAISSKHEKYTILVKRHLSHMASSSIITPKMWLFIQCNGTSIETILLSESPIGMIWLLWLITDNFYLKSQYCLVSSSHMPWALLCRGMQYLSHPGIPGVTLCFCTGSYAAAAAGGVGVGGAASCPRDNFWNNFSDFFHFWHDCWPWPVDYLIRFWSIFVVTLT